MILNKIIIEFWIYKNEFCYYIFKKVVASIKI